MTFAETMLELQQLGNAQTKKTWLNHGVTGECWGVKIGDMKVLQRKIKHDHTLALALYDTGNADAMYFAGLISEPEKMSRKDLQDWVEKADWYMLSEYTVAWVTSESNFGQELALEWIDAKEEKIVASGWTTYSCLLALIQDEELDSKEIKSLLDKIGQTIHNQENRVRYTMNGFLIAVGTHYLPLAAEAKKVAQAIGKVSVEMGETACKVPDALAYIKKQETMGRTGKKKKTVFC